MTDLETKLEAARKLESALEEVREAIQSVNSDAVPPIWTGLIEDLAGFASALRDFVDDPILDAVKRNLSQLANLSGPNRVTPPLSKDFLLDRSDQLERAKSSVERIESTNLRERAGDHVLFVIGTGGTNEAIDAAIQEIDEYAEKATELRKAMGDHNNPSTLLYKVKEHIFSELVEPKNFHVSEIEILKMKWMQVGNADILGNHLALKSDLLHTHFEEHASIESLVEILGDIRNLVNETSFVTKIPKTVDRPPTDLEKSRSEALRSSTGLETVKSSLASVSDSARAWLVTLVAHTNTTVSEIDSVMSYIELPKVLRDAVTDIKSSVIEASSSLDPKSVFDCYAKAERLGRNVRKRVESIHDLTESQRTILSSPEQLATLRAENPDVFWSDIRGLVESGLAEVNLVGKKSQYE